MMKSIGLCAACVLLLSGCGGGEKNLPAPDSETEKEAMDQGENNQGADQPEAPEPESRTLGADRETTQPEEIMPDVSDLSPDPVLGYSDQELIGLAKAYYLKNQGLAPRYGEAEEIPGTYGRVSIWLYDPAGEGVEGGHGVTHSYYYVNRRTAQGTDTNFMPVDLTDVLERREPVNETCYEFVTGIPAADVELYAKKVKQLFLANDWTALSEELDYPATIDGVAFRTREEFLAVNFEEKLNPYFFVELEEESCRSMSGDADGIILGASGNVRIREIQKDDLSSPGLKVTAVKGLTESFGLPAKVRLNIVPDSLNDSSVKLLLENETDLNLVFGDDFKLQRYDYVNDTWEDMKPLTEETEFGNGVYVPKRGAPVEWTADWNSRYGKLEEGRYAVVKTVRDGDAKEESGSFECALDFVISVPRGQDYYFQN